MKEKYRVKMSDGSVWEIPVERIIINRASYYNSKGEAPEFEIDEDEIEDWARGNMDWDDVKFFARLVSPPDDVDFQDGWVNGEIEII